MTKHDQNVHNFTLVVNGTLELFVGLNIVRYDNKTGKPCAAIWTHKTKKPSYCYYFNTVDEREQWIAGKKESESRQNEQRNLYAQQIAKETDALQPGTIVYDSWGWEQTNINFYKIVKRSGASVWLQPLKSKVSETGFMSGNTEPTEETNGEVFLRKIGKYGVKIHSHRGTLTIYDGKPKSCSWYA
jgi:hypothetical protein